MATVASKGLSAIDLEDMTDDKLLGELKKSKEELFNLRFRAATGQLEANHRLKVVKKDIARIYTIMRERELGIRPTPAGK